MTFPGAIGAHAAARGPVVGNAAAGLGGLLASLGISDVQTRDTVEQSVERELAARGYSARVQELRWGRLVLSAGPQDAQLLRFDTSSIVAALEAEHPGAVRDITVRVAR